MEWNPWETRFFITSLAEPMKAETQPTLEVSKQRQANLA